MTLAVDLISPEELDASLVEAWRAMVDADPDLVSPYFQPEFTQVAGAVTPGARVALFRRGGRVIGFFPHQRRGGSIQPLAAPLNDYHGVIVQAGETIGLEQVADLLKAPRLSVGGWVGPANGGERRATVQAALPDGYDAWYAERRATFGKYFKDKERARRSLETELGPIRVERGLTDPTLLDQLIDLKREQYRRTGRHDVFACGWTRDVLHALTRDHHGRFGASMAALWGGDRLAALEISLHATDQYHFWFPVYDPAVARCSPGILLSMDTMRLASADGFRVFDYGFQGESYKKYFCNAERRIVEAVIERPGLARSAGRAAVGLLNATGGGRGDRIGASVRRRWAAIEACEVTPSARLRGALSAVGAAAAKLSPSPAAARA
ncbi:MAG TPA: GNAT family N-acetyltransferase [Brevundimonas sp.]|jgi:CelD/BcsL family acetyltransferase involved in cellulose biosynthesis|uniref:GNAT family N-acetyltransferase n=1 Tax=Brevundimonas sp. TaxID=1871086 RepID=UPI002DE73F3D|nr:GNAT family N-acetyltransferase [Brevundimonas sp.]